MNRRQTRNYEFRNEDLNAVKRLVPTLNALKEPGCVLDDTWEIITKDTDSRLVKYYSGDLCRFLNDAFGIYPRVRRVTDVQAALKNPLHKIFLLEAEDVTDAPVCSDMKNAFHITVTPESVIVIGRSERGTAQGVY